MFEVHRVHMLPTAVRFPRSGWPEDLLGLRGCVSSPGNGGPTVTPAVFWQFSSVGKKIVRMAKTDQAGTWVARWEGRGPLISEW